MAVAKTGVSSPVLEIHCSAICYVGLGGRVYLQRKHAAGRAGRKTGGELHPYAASIQPVGPSNAGVSQAVLIRNEVVTAPSQRVTVTLSSGSFGRAQAGISKGAQAGAGKGPLPEKHSRER